MTMVNSACPSCGDVASRRVYDIGSGPELSCASCEWCWGANGQDLLPLAGTLNLHGFVMAAPVEDIRKGDCPPCKEGKHQRCTREVLGRDDPPGTLNFVPCPCAEREHTTLVKFVPVDESEDEQAW